MKGKIKMNKFGNRGLEINSVVEGYKSHELISKNNKSKYYYVTDTNDADYKYSERVIRQPKGRYKWEYNQPDEEFELEMRRCIEGLTFIKSMLLGEDYLLDKVNSLEEMYDYFGFEEDELSEEDYIEIMEYVGWSVGINSNYGHTLHQVCLVLHGEEYELADLNEDELKELIISWNDTKFYYEKGGELEELTQYENVKIGENVADD